MEQIDVIFVSLKKKEVAVLKKKLLTYKVPSDKLSLFL